MNIQNLSIILGPWSLRPRPGPHHVEETLKKREERDGVCIIDDDLLF